MRLVIDGIFFQAADGGIARLWTSLLRRLVGAPDLDIVMLDRGRSPAITGIRKIPFPAYTGAYAAQDSILIEEVCLRERADVFTSTYYTSPLTTPQLLMIYDMIPEILGFDLQARIWKEKQAAISYADMYACISAQTRDDLRRFYPHVSPNRCCVVHCGVEHEVFTPAEPKAVKAFREQHGLANDYFVTVGARKQQGNYKNVKLLFDAARLGGAGDFDILCIGGEQSIDGGWLSGLPTGTKVHALRLSDAELAVAYSGAAALVYPSFYEGFGLPVIEAMACGCPVITTAHGALGEISGGHALFVSGRDAGELSTAMRQVRTTGVRHRMVGAGLTQAATFDWTKAAGEFHTLLRETAEGGARETRRGFAIAWEHLRRTQATVDVGV